MLANWGRWTTQESEMVEYDEQKQYWETRKKRRSPRHPAVRAFARPKLKYVVDALGCEPDRSSTMLEIGAGNGFFSQTFDEAFNLTCLDFSANMLAMNPLPADRKAVGDAENLQFEDDSFDYAFCGNLLHHLEDPTIAVREMRRIARKNVILIEPNIQNPLMFAFGLSKREEWGSLKFTGTYVRGLGAKCGMSLRAFTSHGTVVPNKTPKPLLPVLKALDGSSPVGFYHVAIFDT